MQQGSPDTMLMILLYDTAVSFEGNLVLKPLQGNSTVYFLVEDSLDFCSRSQHSVGIHRCWKVSGGEKE
jgi:hypothetical protein